MVCALDMPCLIDFEDIAKDMEIEGGSSPVNGGSLKCSKRGIGV